MPAEQLDTRTQTFKLRTPRGTLTVGPHGAIDGLWRVVQREALSNAAVRKLAGDATRKTLLAWRTRDTDPFPNPILKFPSHGGELELWSRTEVEAWLRRNGRRA